MLAANLVKPGDYVPTADQRVVMHQVPWSHYEAILALRGDARSPRMAYLDGAMELMSSSKDHERIKSYVGRLLETYALERGIDLTPYGSWTLKEAPKKAGIEPDECYLIGPDQARDVPDLCIEVIWTSGGIDKLEAYRRLGVREVWIWKDDAPAVYVLDQSAYVERARSSFFPDLEIGFLLSFLEAPTATQAVRALRAALARAT